MNTDNHNYEVYGMMIRPPEEEHNDKCTDSKFKDTTEKINNNTGYKNMVENRQYQKQSLDHQHTFANQINTVRSLHNTNTNITMTPVNTGTNNIFPSYQVQTPPSQIEPSPIHNQPHKYESTMQHNAIQYSELIVEPPPAADNTTGTTTTVTNNYQYNNHDNNLHQYQHQYNYNNTHNINNNTEERIEEQPILQKDHIETTFSEMVYDTPNVRTVPLVVLDCANIGWNYGNHSFQAGGIEITIKFFQKLNFEIQAFIPAGFLRVKPRQIMGNNDNSYKNHNKNQNYDNNNGLMLTDNVEILTILAQKGLISIVPSGDSDDAYILNYARDNNGFVISNDFFHDHLNSISNESIQKSMRIWLSDHRCGYTFASNGEFIFNPNCELRAIVHSYQVQRCGAMQQQQLQQQQQNLQHQLQQLQQPLQPQQQPSAGDPRNPQRGGIYSATDRETPFQYYMLDQDVPVLTQGTVYPGYLLSITQTITQAINQLSILPGCPAPPMGRIWEALEVGIGACGDGRRAGLAESDSLQMELCGLLLVRAGLYMKSGYIKEARADVQYILHHIDPYCEEARALLLQLQIVITGI